MSTNSQPGWTVALRAKQEALEIDIYDNIGSGLFTDGVSAKDVLSQLKAAPKAKKIELRVNSAGGVVDDAKAMWNLLAARKAAGATVHGFVDGIAASAASYLLTVADKVTMPANAFLMFHRAKSIRFGNATEFAAASELLSKTDDQLAEAYASASAARGKSRSKKDFLDAMAKGDTYLTSEEAIEWGLADETSEELQAVAMLADVSQLGDLPDSLAGAPYIAVNAASPEPPKAQPQPTPPVAQQPQAQQTLPLEGIPSREEPMAFTKLFAILNLSADADEDAAVAAVQKIQNSASVGNEVERIVGASGQTAIGVVRALKEGEARSQQLADEVETIKVKMARDQFEALRAQGCKDRKLTSTTAQFYADKFEAAVKMQEDGTRNSDGSDVVADLEGFLKVAPRVVAAPVLQPSDDGSVVAASHGGKKFEEMKPFERHALKRDNPELYNSLRIDALERKAI